MAGGIRSRTSGGGVVEHQLGRPRLSDSTPSDLFLTPTSSRSNNAKSEGGAGIIIIPFLPPRLCFFLPAVFSHHLRYAVFRPGVGGIFKVRISLLPTVALCRGLRDGWFRLALPFPHHAPCGALCNNILAGQLGGPGR